jgi:hypothetical protein
MSLASELRVRTIDGDHELRGQLGFADQRTQALAALFERQLAGRSTREQLVHLFAPTMLTAARISKARGKLVRVAVSAVRRC